MQKISWVAIGLWLVTAVAAATLFVRGQTETALDGREAIQLTDAERTLVLGEMRTLLTAVEGIVTALPDGDMATVAEAARTGGMGTAEGVPPALMLKLPLEFKELGMSVHEGFDAIAVAAREGETQEMILDRLSDTLQRCVTCHASYRFP